MSRTHQPGKGRQMPIQIDRDIPLPRKAGHPFKTMKPGESVFFPLSPAKSSAMMIRKKIRIAALSANASVVTRIVTENGQAGVRAWKLA